MTDFDKFYAWAMPHVPSRDKIYAKLVELKIEQDKELTQMIPAYYATLWQAMTKTAQRCGYALALHGSMNRDLDIVAVPWTEDCDTGFQLVAALCKAHGLIAGRPLKIVKPHGRVAYALVMGGSYYIDLSVMPRRIGE